jgi:hypothetical protein
MTSPVCPPLFTTRIGSEKLRSWACDRATGAHGPSHETIRTTTTRPTRADAPAGRGRSPLRRAGSVVVGTREGEQGLLIVSAPVVECGPAPTARMPGSDCDGRTVGRSEPRSFWTVTATARTNSHDYLNSSGPSKQILRQSRYIKKGSSTDTSRCPCQTPTDRGHGLDFLLRRTKGTVANPSQRSGG